MYLEYWGFKKLPFENVPDPDFIYYSPEHLEALSRLLYVAKGNKGIVLITGEIGSGKTTLSRVMMQQLPRKKYDIGLLVNTTLAPLDFLREVLRSFGFKPGDDLSKSSLLNLLQEKMLENLKQDRGTLLVIDEAQLIPRETFEELRLLLNFQLNNRFLLTVIMLGQPELRSIIKNIEQLNQRVAIRYHLNSLNYIETLKYMGVRFKKAGLTKNIITKQAAKDIYTYSKGTPRLINSVCDASLMVGFVSKVKIIDSGIVKEAVKDIAG
jgi:general secretion pathway protein A